jgi:hypothetical protein
MPGCGLCAQPELPSTCSICEGWKRIVVDRSPYSSRFKAALSYAKRGIPVFPCPDASPVPVVLLVGQPTDDGVGWLAAGDFVGGRVEQGHVLRGGVEDHAARAHRADPSWFRPFGPQRLRLCHPRKPPKPRPASKTPSTALPVRRSIRRVTFRFNSGAATERSFATSDEPPNEE